MFLKLCMLWLERYFLDDGGFMKKKLLIRWDIFDVLYLFNIIVCKDVFNFFNNWYVELVVIGKYFLKWSDN